GYALYQTQSYKRAATYLEQLSNVDSELGQTAMYLLADSYLKSNDSTKAKNAFAAASRLSHNVQIQEDALISYAKLSYETNNDQEAITAIQKIPQTSENYMKGQQLLSEICLTSRDYARAISILEQLPEKNMKMKEIYQKVLCYRGIQLVTDNNPDEAEKVFLRSNDLGIDKQTKAISTFWLADIAHQNKLYEKSSQYASQFLNIADGVSGLPNEASVYTGRYLQGYNYLKLEKYADAFTNFKECVNGIKKNKDNIIGNEYITKEVYGDAILRAGDCLFKRDNYKDAMKYYDETVNKKYTGFVYALYQKAMVQGLQGQSYDKVVSLDYIVDNYPKSEYTDDALWQLGVTYLELNKPERAIEPLRKIVNNFGGKSELVNKAYLRLGLITFNQGDNNGSITYYKKVIENNPTSNERTEALHALEEIYVKELGKPDEYFDVVETSTGTKVNEIAKDSINFNAAMAQYETGNCDKAIESFSSYINKFSKSSNALIAYNFRAECYLEKKDFTKAYSDYENVIERGQSKYFANALVKAASIAYNDKKDFAKAFEYYTKLESVANNDEMRFNAQLGAMRSAYRNKNTEGVKEMARKLTESSKASKENLSTAHYYLGKIAYDEKNNDSALASLNKCAKMVNNEFAAEARYLIADIYYQQRELDIAEKLCLKANEESAGYDFWIAKSLILVADIYAEKGDIFSARGALEALIENFKDKELVAIAKAKLAKLNNENAQVEKTVKSDVLELDEDDKN
ncbi:MAG: tetratricopeptide repeat protein, partial [Saprospiraceae bacterium]